MSFWRRDSVWAIFVTLSVWLCSAFVPVSPANDYFAVTALHFLQTGTVFLVQNGHFNELIPTTHGFVLVMPPFPLLPTGIGLLFHLEEFMVTQLGVGIVAALFFLIMRYYRLSRLRSMIAVIFYLLTTPLLFFFVQAGYWQSAQVWGIVGAELALYMLLTKHHTLAGIGTGIAILSRLNLGIITAVGMMFYLFRDRGLSNLVRYGLIVTGSLCLLFWWNYYRFGSIWQIGYSLIPGVLTEPWYAHGIVHPSYLWGNLQRFLWQRDLQGAGLGILWAQPYLFFLPWIMSKRNWGLIMLGFCQFFFVLMHGWWGASQFDFRFLMDSLWLFFPALLLPYKDWRQWVIWITLTISAIVHLAYISPFIG